MAVFRNIGCNYCAVCELIITCIICSAPKVPGNLESCPEVISTQSKTWIGSMTTANTSCQPVWTKRPGFTHLGTVTTNLFIRAIPVGTKSPGLRSTDTTSSA